MADYRAVRAVGEAVVNLLESSYQAPDFNGIAADFRMFTSRDFTDNSITNGASLFMYRLFCNGAYRTPRGRMRADGRHTDSQLPLELHFLLTVWGSEASFQCELAGWIMRVLEDTPTFSSGILNSVTQNVFQPDETVDITHSDLSTEDLLRVWEVLGVNAYYLSIPYLARVVNIESAQVRGGEFDIPVQEREQRQSVLELPDA